METFTYQELRNEYEEITGVLRCECSLATELVGGQPAKEEGIRAFAEHHLKLVGEELENAVQRILSQEVGGKDIRPPEGELDERLTYGVNVIRRTSNGPWIGDWMVKACLKQAASRLGIFIQQKGSKGNMAEAGNVRATGASFLDKDNPERIYLRNGNGAAKTYWQEFLGRVQSPQGAVSIVRHSECAAPGSTFSFEYRFLPGKMNIEDIKQVLSLAMVCGLGSAKSFERGKFIIEKCEVDIPKKKKKEQE